MTRLYFSACYGNTCPGGMLTGLSINRPTASLWIQQVWGPHNDHISSVLIVEADWGLTPLYFWAALLIGSWLTWACRTACTVPLFQDVRAWNSWWVCYRLGWWAASRSGNHNVQIHNRTVLPVREMKLKVGKHEEGPGDGANLTLQVKGWLVWLDSGEKFESIVKVLNHELLYPLHLVPEEGKLSGSQILFLWLK